MSNKIGRAGLGFARVWHHIDLAEEPRTLGRLASQIAIVLIGKHKPIYHETQDIGDYVVVSNCQYLKTTGNKLTEKTYWSHTTRPGSGKATPMEVVIENHGWGEVLKRAVSKMLPKNNHRWARLDRLKVFDGSEHPYKQNLIAWADEAPKVQKRVEGLKERAKILEDYNKRLAARKL
ncbi:unnamed protein product [Ambrosiozyma monospora]|uniref:Unnamed protein product n=1 Tax=Ambrosiozyma monospora TaxID=43982 RepID=A0ACB5TNW8_AMBMO|nr:unnamed protein product [Ambrosiozyma monospora]